MLKNPFHLFLHEKGLGGDRAEVFFFSQSELSLVYHQLSRASCCIASLAIAGCIQAQRQQLHECSGAGRIGCCGSGEPWQERSLCPRLFP